MIHKPLSFLQRLSPRRLVHHLRLTLLVLTILSLAACQPIQALPATQTTATVSAETPLEQANKAVVQRFYEEVANQKKVEVFKEVFDPHMVEHALGYGPQLFRDVDLFAGFPDQHLTVDLWLVKGDLVAAVVTVTGTQTGKFIGIAPTGKKITFSQIDIWRVRNGKITDVWHNFASADILQQVGYKLVPPTK
ncbi:MAG: ester cyclase [Caldilineaceae bacterium]